MNSCRVSNGLTPPAKCDDLGKTRSIGGHRIKPLSALCCLALSALPVHAADVKWEQAPTGFLANSAPRGTFDYQGRNAEIARIPLVWVEAARIDAPVTFTFGKETQTLSAGTSLPAVTLRNAAPGGQERLVYCTPSRVKEKVKTASLFAVLENSLVNSLSDSQKCLEDTDNDGTFDRTLMVGQGPNDMTTGIAIAPLPYAVVRNQPIGPKDYVVLKLAGVGKDSVTIEFAIYQDGKQKRFKKVVAGGYSAERMNRFKRVPDFGAPREIFGIRFVIVAADPQGKSVKIEWPQGAPTDALPLIPLEVNYNYF